MRYSRQKIILELINKYEIETQEKLCQLLRNSGFNITQATVSRDIKELQLVKTLSPSGKYKYTVSTSKDGPVNDRFVKIFKETIISVNASGNIVLVKTLSGCGPAAGEAIDSLGIPHTIGSVAGDNTVLIVADDPANVETILDKFNNILG
ncbi:MAG: arginine repressor [Eubacterium sp.]|nr:arginine repressor [Eubacterium sp.]